VARNGMAAIIAALVMIVMAGPGRAQNAYISNMADNTVSVIDTATNSVTATIPVGAQPFAVAVPQHGGRAYVGNQGDDTVSVIDTATNIVIATIPVGGIPTGVVVTPDGSKAYVGVGVVDDSTIAAIDTASNTVTAILPNFGYPAALAMTPDGGKYYVVARSGTGGFFDVFSTTEDTGPFGSALGNNQLIFQFYGVVAVPPDGGKAYATARGGLVVAYSVTNSAPYFSLATAITGIQTNQHFPYGVAATPDGSRVYVGDLNGNTVAAIDIASNTVIGALIPVGNNPSGVSVTPDGSKVYVANSRSNNVSVISTATNAVIATIPVGNSPQAFGQFIGPAPVLVPIPVPGPGTGGLLLGALLLGAAGAYHVTRRKAA